MTIKYHSFSCSPVRNATQSPAAPKGSAQQALLGAYKDQKDQKLREKPQHPSCCHCKDLPKAKRLIGVC